WCYHLPSCNDTTWPRISLQYCSGSRQSPINIVSASATPNEKLTEFTFFNVISWDLSEQYDSLQFHLHWGNGSSVPGAEHTVDGKRYPMEVQIFFNVYFVHLSCTFSIAAGFSLDDLLVGVDRTKYYRYLGSLTTPACNEAVVWTVFKEPIKVSKDLIDLFSTTLHFNDSMSPLMTNVYRSLQPAQKVWTQSIKASASTTCFSLVYQTVIEGSGDCLVLVIFCIYFKLL
uniref:Carbonic anhydrase 4-like n=1 Tax=Haplochromis burtoni TaxID=8153 RepID=A0A3Q2X0Q1_HAPBU